MRRWGPRGCSHTHAQRLHSQAASAAATGGGVAFDPKLGLVFVNTSELGRAPGGGGRGRGVGAARARRPPSQPASSRFVDPNYLPL